MRTREPLFTGHRDYTDFRFIIEAGKRARAEAKAKPQQQGTAAVALPEYAEPEQDDGYLTVYDVPSPTLNADSGVLPDAFALDVYGDHPCAYVR